ncbi:FAD-binding protein [Lacticaseibacillus rhamnosus]
MIVVGGGLAGLTAILKLCEAGVPVDVFSLVPVKRSHSVCAQGGINASVNTKGEGDSPRIHLEEDVAKSFHFENSTGIDFNRAGIYADQVPLASCIGPAAVIDFSERAAKDPDATLSVDDLKAYETQFGKIPDGAFVVADDIDLFPEPLRPYLDYVRNPGSGYVSVTLPVGDAMELSVRTG